MAASKATNPTGRKPTGSLNWTGAVFWRPPFFSGLSLSNFFCLPACLALICHGGLPSLPQNRVL
ncbi:hypothetical protein CCUS01_09652 [Colletotrichum cuscutae]|uniref:Uncharacterized protein n=1 Tax=Colletotrichum cuscutae TaxID=1209917 RepID=A0AAI9UKC5_9PEZI|nr:hypothetical protein CCUS01_09652 [Colletotrichum cuscutae]